MKLIKVIKDTGAHRVAEYRDTEVIDMDMERILILFMFIKSKFIIVDFGLL